ncbi:RHS repeat-associated core domain-containing protein [Streptomyces sp. NPDC001941]|uniref:RHS repeat domain-containing protein n=1 Tax=Streptomyces sp. NPDC001941 TaxID=3154659 RepID=UPI00332E52B7
MTWPSAGEGEADLAAPAPEPRGADPRSHRLPHTKIDGLPVKVAPLAGMPRGAEPEPSGKESKPSGTEQESAQQKTPSPQTPSPSPTPSEQPESKTKDTDTPEPTGTSSDSSSETPSRTPDPTAAPSDSPKPADSSGIPETRDVAGGAPQRLHVKVTSRKHAAKLGIDGPLVGVSRSDGQNKPGRASVQLDYTGFRHAYGADWASRLQLVQLPACALTTPNKPACKTITPLPTHNNTKDGLLTAQVDVAADKGAKAPREATVLAATAAPEGANGDYKATKLSPSGHWKAGGNEGGFNWSYDLAMPPVAGKLAPQLGLGYSSSSIDGRSAASNNQPSWIGEGWSLDMGFIERQYMSCKDDNGSGSNAPKKTGDLCWRSDNAVMSLDGQHTALVKDDSTGAWKPARDDGTRIEHLKGSASDTANGDDDNEYWKITKADGSQYWFGKNRLPGWSSGKPETGSAFTVPVYGNHAGEPGHGDSFAGSVTTQAWRWNLDYVVDPHGNAMALFYDQEKNAYAKNSANSTEKPKANATYVRGGHLNRIEYGHRAGQVYSADAAARVNFAVADRCTSTGDGCKFDKDHADNWPDTPVDQQCEINKECLNSSPTFWSKKRVSSLTTQVRKDDAYQDVDVWSFTHEFPGTGDAGGNGLFLSSITHTGKTGKTPVALPKVDFGGTLMPNRVDTDEGRPPLNKYRITRISNDSGADTLVDYSQPECKAGATPAPDATNTRRCYPVWWTPNGAPDPVSDWFHKYLATKITEDDKVAGSEQVITEYEYLGGIAWAKNTSEFTLDKHRTYSDFRGYGKVRTRTGAKDKTLTESTFLRGLDGTTVTGSRGDTATDAQQYAGLELEQAKYDKDGGRVTETAFHKPWSRQTASQTRPGTTAEKAYQTAPGTDETHTALDGGTWRTTRSTHDYNDYGQPTTVSDEGDTAVTGDELCTRTTYTTPDTTHWMLSYPATVTKTSATCATSASPKNTLSEVRTSYDAKAHGAAPDFGKANATELAELERFDGGKAVYTTTAKNTFDAVGRVLQTTDATGHTKSTAYTPAGTVQPTLLTTTDQKGEKSLVHMDGLRGLPVKTVDANGHSTTQQYDALGRMTAVWKPGKSTSGPADLTFAYQVRRDAPTAVTTGVLRENGGYRTSVDLYDGLLRHRQTQTDAFGDKGRIVKDTIHDSQGRPYKVNTDYFNDASRSEPVVLVVADNQVPSQTVTEYDGQGRPTASITKSKNTEKWRATTTYGGGWTANVPPQGGTATLAINNAHGKPVELREYKNSTPDIDAPATTYDALTYTYDVADRLTQLQDADGNTWKTEYDLRGRAVRTTDPDKGTVVSSYTPDGHLERTEDARGQVLFRSYDALGRPTGIREDAADGTLLASWAYDTLPHGKGKLTSSTRYDNGSAYTRSVTGYDEAGRATGAGFTLPDTEGKLAGTYTFESTYTPNTGLVDTTSYPEAGGLPAETVQQEYTENGLPTALSNGSDVYSLGTEYSPHGEVLQTILGDVGGRSVQTFSYEEHTRRLAGVINDREADGPQTIDDKTYTYDPAGNVTRISNHRDDRATEDTQCYAYDYARRLTDAWTAKDGCTAQPSGNVTPKVGGVDAYWHSYTYDAVGNRTSEKQHDPAGEKAKDIERRYTYPDSGAARPHAMDKVTATGPGARDDSFAYDETGNTTRRVTARGDQKLTWDAEGHLETSTIDGKTSSFVYDAEGVRLLRKEPGKTTLYMDSQELTLTTADSKVSGVRYYKSQKATIVATSEGGLSYLLSDHHGTDEVAVDAYSLEYTRRGQTAFGTPRGEQPQDGAWPGEKGFVGGTNDGSTGFVHIGAREYDSENGKFISVDPVMDLTDPQQINPYSYGNNNPTTFSDPDGKLTWKWTPAYFQRYIVPKLNTWYKQMQKRPQTAAVLQAMWTKLVKEQQQASKKDDTSGFGLFVKWLAGVGPGNYKFGPGDKMTEEIRKDHSMDVVRAEVKKAIGQGKTKGSGTFNELAKDGIWRLPDDLMNVLLPDFLSGRSIIESGSNGQFGSEAAAFLGSYSYEWKVTGRDKKTGEVSVQFTLKNDTTVNSAIHPPFAAARKIWDSSVGPALNWLADNQPSLFKPGRIQSQTISWTEKWNK